MSTVHLLALNDKMRTWKCVMAAASAEDSAVKTVLKLGVKVLKQRWAN